MATCMYLEWIQVNNGRYAGRHVVCRSRACTSHQLASRNPDDKDETTKNTCFTSVDFCTKGPVYTSNGLFSKGKEKRCPHYSG